MVEMILNGRTGNRRRDAIRAAVRRPVRALRLKTGRAKTGASTIPAPTVAPIVDKGGQATVFVSYSREDLEIVRGLVERLRAGGLTVTWDQDFPAGLDFERWIRDSIDRVRSVIVVWSQASAASAFVRDEARRALRAGKLITTHVAGFDVGEVPLGFGNLHVIPTDDEPGLRRTFAQHGIDLRG